MRVGDGDGSRGGAGAPKKALLRGMWGARPLAWDFKGVCASATGVKSEVRENTRSWGLLSMLGRQLWLVQEAKGEGLRAAGKGTVSAGGLLCLGKRRKLPVTGYCTLPRGLRTLDGAIISGFLPPVPSLVWPSSGMGYCL